MKNSTIRQAQKQASEVSSLPVKVVEELRRTVDSAYDEVSRGVRRAKNTANDVIYDSRYQIKRHPLAAVGSAAGAGLVLGFVIGWLARSSRRPV